MAKLNQNLTSDFTGNAESDGPGGLDPYVYYVYSVTVRVAITGVFSAAGIITNIVNVVVFYRQGLLTDSSNASLTCLAATDFLNCVFVFWGSWCYMTKHFIHTPTIVITDACYLTADKPILVCTQIVCWITAYISLERFCSVMFPFKVKYLFTAKRAYIILSMVSVITVCYYYPKLSDVYLGWKHRNSNESQIIGIIGNEYMKSILENTISLEISFRICTVLIVLVCNVMIYFKVNLSQKFKRTATSITKQTKSSGGQGSQEKTLDANPKTTQREKKLLRMLMIICALFLVCYATDIVIVFLTQLELGPNYDWLTMGVFYTTNTFLVTFNSSCNIIIYYTMSTKYRQELRLWLCGEKKD